MLSFTETRARNSDPDTSHAAAVHAGSVKACAERLAICRCLQDSPYGLTAWEIARLTVTPAVRVYCGGGGLVGRGQLMRKRGHAASANSPACSFSASSTFRHASS